MPLNLYDLTIPLFIRALTNLDAQLTKAEQWAKEHSVSDSDLATGSLIADMRPLTFQIQTASNTAKNTITRIAGSAAVPMDDNEKTIADLHARISKTIEMLKAAKREDFEGKEAAEVKFVTGGKEMVFTGLKYVQGFALPNFWFHVVTAYDILRSKGVPIGKMDFLGTP